MSNKEIPILVFIYNSYKDPLFQNLMLSYIKSLSEVGNYRFDLITFEQPKYSLSNQEIVKEKEKLKKHNVHWHPRDYHTGRLILIKKLWDVFTTLITVIWIKLRNQPKYVFAFANVAAAFSILFSKLLNMKLVIYSYEPHSEFMVDLGIWNRKNLQYKVLSKLEFLAGKYSNHVLTGTKYGISLLETIGSKAQLYRAPTAVDSNLFYFKKEGRDRIRSLYDLENKQVYLYLGKFGGLYYKNEIAIVCKKLWELNPSSFFLILTPNDHQVIEEWFQLEEVPDTCYSIISELDREEIIDYISASDMGLNAIPPSPSQKYRSPTKVAEYLLCGLPFITCTGVSEDDDYAIEEKVGVVIKKFSSEEIKNNYATIKRLFEEDKHNLRKRCRKVGLEYRSKERVDNILKSIFT